jgi:hypothetical protein
MWPELRFESRLQFGDDVFRACRSMAAPTAGCRREAEIANPNGLTRQKFKSKEILERSGAL